MGPPTRPLINAKLRPNAGLGNLVFRVINPSRKEANYNNMTEVVYPKELLRAIQDYNECGFVAPTPTLVASTASMPGMLSDLGPRRRAPPRTCSTMQGNHLVLGSLHVKSLYPSCRSGPLGGHIRTFDRDSKLRFGWENQKAIVRFLGLPGGRKNSPEIDGFIPLQKGTTT